ncbi:MAG: hypothetical protein M3126_09635 [Candidatus Eremiobacteraeota bacterium]|nr:hypothetical protein [Candidatus Eremiobacteraeota bacterium]
MNTTRLPHENTDTVSLICALLVRFPEIASVRSMPSDGNVRFTFVVSRKLDRAAQRAVIAAIDDHVGSFLHLEGDAARTVLVECETDKAMTFVHVTRDLETFSRDELTLLVAMFAERFAETLVRNPAPEDAFDEDPAAAEDLIDCAIDSMRDPKQSKSLVGFREEKRVLVYFLKSQKKAKASARS